jgi:predicted GNAT family acetyltransferase
MNFVTITPENADKESFYCLKNPKHKGFIAKKKWLKDRIVEGYTIKILKDDSNKSLGLIEFVPAEFAWRPIKAKGFMFIQCILIISKSDTKKGYAGMMIQHCIDEAKRMGMKGVATMCSEGSWIADKRVFIKHGFREAESLDRFQLLYLKFEKEATDPELNNYTESRKKIKGWQLFYANQCPLFDTTIEPMIKEAEKFDIDLKVTEYQLAKEAQGAPSGFGVFSLIKDGELLADNYISKTRFTNIIKKEIGK